MPFQSPPPARPNVWLRPWLAMCLALVAAVIAVDLSADDVSIVALLAAAPLLAALRLHLRPVALVGVLASAGALFLGVHHVILTLGSDELQRVLIVIGCSAVAMLLARRREQLDVRLALKNAEAQARRLSFEAIFSSNLDAIAIVDDHRRFLEVNAAACELYGLDRDELVGRHTDDFSLMNAAERDSAWLTFLQHGQFRADLPLRRADGTVLTVDYACKSHFLPGRHLVQVRDISSRRRREQHDRLLSEVSGLLVASLDWERTLQQVAEAATPLLADWCAVDLLDPSGALRPVAVAHQDPATLELAARQRTLQPARSAQGGAVAQVIATGRSALHEQITDQAIIAEARDEQHLKLLRSAQMRSAMIVPMIARGRTLGAITLVSSTSGRAFDREDLALAEDLAGRCALALDNARLYREREAQARTLQQSLLPPALPDVPGLLLASAYMPAGEGNEVGGDFYDAFAVGDGRWVLALGDVCGKGAEAAAVTALVRYTIRALAARHQHPSQLLAEVNDAMLRQRDDGRFVTLAVGYLTPCQDGAGGQLELALGGHHEPVLTGRDGAQRRVGRRGSLLGVLDQVTFHDELVELGPGDSLLLFSDGVVERRIDGRAREDDQALEITLQRLAASCDPQIVVDQVVDEVLSSQGGAAFDDVTLLALRAPHPADRDLLSAQLPADPQSVAPVRRTVERMAQRTASVDSGALALALSELAANAVRHSAGNGYQVALRRTEVDGLRLQVTSDGEADLHAALPDESATGGRGLWLVESMAARWGVERADRRTIVWCEFDPVDPIGG